MPVYIYQCDTCGECCEARRPVAERDSAPECASCAARTRRVFGAGVQVKVPFWWGNFTGADLDPDPDERPEFARKSYAMSGEAKPLNNRRRF